MKHVVDMLTCIYIMLTIMTDQRSVLAGGAGICVDERATITVINLTAVAVHHHHHHVNVRMHHCITGMTDQRSVLAGGAGICVDAWAAIIVDNLNNSQLLININIIIIINVIISISDFLVIQVDFRVSFIHKHSITRY